ncbi:MAG: hypothetical protein M3619_17895, partial [Myxococcota bacterium]|nr:hypothetical protein [Myxococcota bacterium]
VRALLGQQVSVAAATTLAGRFAAAFGVPHAGGDGLVVRFPTAAEVARVGIDAIAAIGLPGARAAAVSALASAIADRSLRLDGVRDLDRFVAEIVELPGIGPWTAHYLAMRALHLPDAFPAADLGIRKALDATPRKAEARAEAWRPFRSYAVMHLWTSLGGTDDTDDDDDDAMSGRRAAPRGERDRAGRRVSAGPGRARPKRGARRREPVARARREPARRVLRG